VKYNLYYYFKAEIFSSIVKLSLFVLFDTVDLPSETVYCQLKEQNMFPVAQSLPDFQTFDVLKC
jgi:hypothetical protein